MMRLFLLPALLFVACGPANAPMPEPADSETNASQALHDHHMHIQSATAAELFALVQEVASELSEDEAPPLEPAKVTTAADAIVALDAAGLRHGAVLSNAYMVGMPEITTDAVETEAAKVRAENSWVAEQAAQFPERLVGLCSFNPLRPYALDELDRCAADERIGGLKLHLANSDVDLRDDGHVARLAELWRKLETHGMPVLVHLRTRNEDYGREDVSRFLRDIADPSPGVRMQIAHMAGWGGYDDATDAALGAFIDAIEGETLQSRPLVFGLGAVVFSPAAAGDNEELARQVREGNEKLAQRIVELGVDRVVYATDWPAWPPVPDSSEGITKNLELIRAELPLEDDAFDRILANPGVLWSRASQQIQD